ncbi:uncharacterized protein [Hemitrygon akajei]|uniref:uncharacterized protein n=1 Tax=Hemitrygon akajei TaxID=2704970 RepID=UPI003BF9AB28
MAHTPAVLRLVGFIWILVPGLCTKEDAGTCENVTNPDSYQSFVNSLQEYSNCMEQVINKLNATEHSELYRLLQTAADNVRSIHRKDCQTVIPKNCSLPIVPVNGGLLCLTMNKTRYCKPMCNKGFDFKFLRKSRLYERCGEATKYKWTTQYIGGSRLADCSESSRAVSAYPSQYFPTSCRDVLYNHSLETDLISTFRKEVKQNVDGKVNSKTMCLLCGN